MSTSITNQIRQTADWFIETKQMSAPLAPNVKQVGFYTGMQLEELAEKLTAIFGEKPLITAIESLATSFKEGSYDAAVSKALQDPQKAHDILDADVDVLWVTIGSGAAQGANLEGAYSEVAGKNWDKKFPDGTFHLAPVTGKVLKPTEHGWTAPNLHPFVHPSLQPLSKAV